MSSVSQIPGHSLPRVVSRLVGGSCLAFAALGILYSGMSAIAIYSSYSFDPAAPYFLSAYSTLLVLTLMAYAALVYGGIQLFRLRTRAHRVVLAVAVSEVVLMFGTALMWNAGPAIAGSVAAATGVALGGLMPQFITLFPLWGPISASWAHRRIALLPEKRRRMGLCPYCGYPRRQSLICSECGQGD